jgi:hypothetical protein
MFGLSQMMTIVIFISFVFMLAFSTAFYAIIWRPANQARGLTDDKRFELRISSLTLFAQLIGGAIALPTLIWTVEKDRQTLKTQQIAAADSAYGDALKMAGANDQGNIFAGFTSLQRIVRTNPDFWPTVLALAVWKVRYEPAPDSTGHAYKPVASGEQGAIDLIASHTVLVDHAVASNALCAAYANNPDVVDLNGVYLAGARAINATGFAGAYLAGAWLYGFDFKGADLTCAHLDGAHAEDYRAFGVWPNDKLAHLPDWLEWQRYRFVINFSGAHLMHAQFHNAGLTGAIFTGSDVDGADFRGADLSRADFRGALHVSTAHFAGACQKDPPLFDSAVDPKVPFCK